jgi:hypothetical protein
MTVMSDEEDHGHGQPTYYEPIEKSAPVAHLIPEPIREPVTIPAERPIPQVSAPTQHLVPDTGKAEPKGK